MSKSNLIIQLHNTVNSIKVIACSSVLIKKLCRVDEKQINKAMSKQQVYSYALDK